MKTDMTHDSSFSILAIDDTVENLRYLGEILRESGYTVRLARDGKTGLSSAFALPPDLILLDIMLPDIDGYEVCRRLKAEPLTRDVPVIFVSALNELFDKIKAFAAGGVDYINKPFHLEEVLARVKTHVTIRSLQQQLQHQNAQLQQQISERQQTEAALRAMSQASHDPIITIDDGGRILFWNPAAERLFGYRAEEVVGCDLHELVAAQAERERAHIGLKQFAQTGTGVILERVREVQARRKDGVMFPVELSVAAFQFNDQWRAVGSIRDITARKEAERQLRELATTDSLTGLANRRHFFECAEQELTRCQRYNRPFALLMLDIDHFKRVNDIYGHESGDHVLEAVAQAGQMMLRESDVIGRLGGEEFAVLLPETDLPSALQAAERLRQAIGSLSIASGENTIHVTISLGAAVMNGDAHSIEPLLKRADQALYRAKSGGRNRVEY